MQTHGHISTQCMCTYFAEHVQVYTLYVSICPKISITFLLVVHLLSYKLISFSCGDICKLIMLLVSSLIYNVLRLKGHKTFDGLRSCNNVQTERKIFEYVNWRRLQIKRTGPSSWSIQLVRPAGPFSWSVQLV